MLILYDTNHNKIGGLVNYKNLNITRELKKVDALSFLYPVSDSKRDLIQEECYLKTRDNEYVIKEINYSDDNYDQIICQVNIEDIIGNVVEHFETKDQECKDCVNLVLSGTGWTIGSCDVTRLRTVKKSMCTSYDVLKEIADVYNCEITYDAINKKVYVYSSMGTDRGIYFSNQLNLKKVDTQSNTNNYVTRLIPIGKDNLSIASVNNGCNYVENHDYSSKVVTAYWNDNRYTVPEELKEDAVERLKYLSQPQKSYSCDVYDLASISEKYKDILDYGLGDTVTLLDKKRNVKVKQRIVKLTLYPDNPDKNTCEISNKIAGVEDLITRFSDTSDTVDDVTTSDGMVDGSKIDSIDTDNIGHVHIKIGDIENLNATISNIGKLNATEGNITLLNSANANIKNLVSDKADVKDLTAAAGKIEVLETDSARINDLLAGNISAKNIHAGAITAGSGVIADGAIGTAQISELDAKVIQSGKIDTALVNITSGDNHLNITGSKIQFFDTDSSGKMFERICIGDVNGDNSDEAIRIRAKDGKTTLFDTDGITKEGFTDGYGKLDNNSLDPSKIDIEKTVTAINGATTKINGSSITVDNETLSSKFSNMQSNINNIQVGIRNLLLNSGWKNNSNSWYTEGNFSLLNEEFSSISNDKDNDIGQLITLAPNTTYTLTVKAKVIKPVNQVTLALFYLDNAWNKQIFHINNTDYQPYTFTFTTNSNGGTAIAFDNYYTATGNGTLVLKEPMLVQGNKASADWIEAPEDISAGIQVGGRNLLLGTQTIANFDFANYGGNIGSILSDVKSNEIPAGLNSQNCGIKRITLSNSGWRMMYKPNYNFEANSYAFSAYMYVSNDYTGAIPSIYLNSNNRAWYDLSKKGTWQKLIVTVNFSITGEEEVAFALSWAGNATGTILITMPKLEMGNKATDWTPAPEDVQTQIDSHTSEIKQTADAIGFDLSTMQLKTTENYETFKDIQTFIQANHEKISSVITNTDISKAINNIQVGGRNLIRNSGLVKDADYFNLASGITRDTSFLDNGYNTFNYNITGLTSNAWKSADPLYVKAIAGQTYTASVDVYIPTGHNINNDCRLEIQYFDTAESTRLGYTDKQVNFNILDQWQKVVVTGTAPAGTGYINARIWVGMNGHLWVADLKLELGNKPTDWTPAPEDMQDQITTLNTNYSSLSQTVNGFQSTVSSVKTTIDNMQIGGRNLVQEFSSLKWDLKNGILHQSAYKNHNVLEKPIVSSGYNDSVFDFLATPGIKYTFSAWIKGITQIFLVPMKTVDDSWNPTTTEYQDNEHTINGGTDYSYQYFTTFTTPSDTVRMRLLIRSYTGITTDAFISMLKVELGNKPTDWTPAPEDIQTQIDSHTTEISQLSTSISSKVDANGVISTIQQNPNAVEFAFNQINSAKVKIDAEGLHVKGGEIDSADFYEIYPSGNAKMSIDDGGIQFYKDGNQYKVNGVGLPCGELIGSIDVIEGYDGNALIGLSSFNKSTSFYVGAYDPRGIIDGYYGSAFRGTNDVNGHGDTYVYGNNIHLTTPKAEFDLFGGSNPSSINLSADTLNLFTNIWTNGNIKISGNLDVSNSLNVSNLNTTNQAVISGGIKPNYSANLTLNSGQSTVFYHLLGHIPIVVLSGTLGNVNVTYKVDTDSIEIYNYNSGGNAWSGTVYLW